MYKDEELIAKYLELRDQLERMENMHKLAIMPYKESLSTLENVFSVMITERKVKNIKTEVGTAFPREIFTCTATNLGEFVQYAVDKAPTMLKIEPSTTGVNEYIKEETKRQSKLLENERIPIIIPGLKTDKIIKIVVRKI